MRQHHNKHFPVELSSHLVSIITTEHYSSKKSSERERFLAFS